MYSRFKILNNLNHLLISIIIICSLINLSFCLYEDQIGKFDWKQNFVGKIKDAYFDGQSNNEKIIVATEENVLAALNAKNGDILWRQVLEKNLGGKINLLYVPNSLQIENSVAISGSHDDSTIITVSGNNPALIRGWHSNNGNLVFEWLLTPVSPTKAENAFWYCDNTYIYFIVPVWESHIEVAIYHANTGVAKKSTANKFISPWINKDTCVFSSPFFVCVVKDQLIGVNIAADSSELITWTLNKNISERPKLLRGSRNNIILGEEIMSIIDKKYLNKIKSSINFQFENKLFSAEIKDESIEISTTDINSKTTNVNMVSNYPKSMGLPTIFDITCKSNSKQIRESTDLPVCKYLLSTENGAILLMQQNKIKWTREEALANIIGVEMIDLPLSDDEGVIENELNNKDGDVISAFMRRITSQILQIKNLILNTIGLGAPPSASQKAGLVRDAFGLHKIIIAVTGLGKIFAIDNISGKHYWMTYLQNFESFDNDQPMQLIVQRTTKHFPYPAQCVILGKHKETGNGLMYEFNPISGAAINDGIIELNYKIKQYVLLPHPEIDFLKSILLLDHNDQLHTIPENTSKLADGHYMYTACRNSGVISGFYATYTTNNELKAIPLWKINLGGIGNTQQIIKIAKKNPIEHVHSQGRVLGDRSVLYKYINPNLIAVATQGLDSIHKFVLNVHLIDVVSGNVVYSMTHRRVKEPIHMVHSENWLVYSYYNEKLRRTEITTLELYEGKTQTNSTVWSSLDAPPLPMAERQSYIFAANIVTLKETITEKGITNKHVLIGLANGGILEMPWFFLDPRRPILMANQMREEGVIPYIPELQIPSENIINYNQSIERIHGIYTAPSGLESTCLVVAYGLDLFITRVAPSKTYDLLKEDFDYILISIVLLSLTIASCIVKHLSFKKIIKQAWK